MCIIRWDAFEQDKFDRLQADIERLEVEEQDRLKEIEERDTIIESLREKIERIGNSKIGNKSEFEEKLRMEVEGFQEQVWRTPFCFARLLTCE